MRYIGAVRSVVPRLLSGGMLVLAVASAFGQVNPDEILNPKSRAVEQKYLPQLQTLQKSIAEFQFPFSFRLARYLNARAGKRAATDSNGLEFVYFQHRVVLKISGIYKAAFNSMELTENERASRTFQDVAVPVLRLVAKHLPQSVDCDGIGFEIVYDARDANGAYDYEGQEVLTVVFSRDDAYNYANASKDAERQLILNRSDIYVNSKEFGLALGQRDSLNVQALERSIPRQVAEPPTMPQSAGHVVLVSEEATTSSAVSGPKLKAASLTPSTFKDSIQLQAEFQEQLNAIVKEDGAKFHLSESAAPSFESNNDRIILHFTMQNILPFERSATSIYKRAAQSFDLFLAPELRDLSMKVPPPGRFDALDVSVVNNFGAGDNSPETIDYICPLNSVHSFVDNKITSQDLINQSIVLVNGVRIALNLQLVE